MLFRRLPWVMALRGLIPDIVTWQEAAFTGWFGPSQSPCTTLPAAVADFWRPPVGVGAVYYAQVGLRRIPEDREHLRSVIVPVVYFIVLCSVIVHGVTIPIFKRKATVSQSDLP
jgi:NhaP-type Na+/H+ or K+/H+ antiporter